MNQFKVASERGLIITVVGALLMLTLPSVSAPTINPLSITTSSIQSQLSKVNLSIDQTILGNNSNDAKNPKNNLAGNWGFSSMVRAVTSTVSRAVAPIARAVAAPVTRVVQAAIAAPAYVATKAVQAVAVVAKVAVKAVAVVVPAAAKALPAIEKVSTSITSTIAKTSTAMQANVAAASSTIQTVVNTAIVGLVVGLAVAAVTVAAIALAPATAAIAGGTMALVVMAAVTAGTMGAVVCSVVGASPCSPKPAPVVAPPLAAPADNTVQAAKDTPSFAALPKKAPVVVIDKAQPDTTKVEVTTTTVTPLDTTILKLGTAINTTNPTAEDKVIITGKVTELNAEIAKRKALLLNPSCDAACIAQTNTDIVLLENAKAALPTIKVARPS